MYVKVADGQAVFATHMVKPGDIEKVRELPFQIEDDGIVCYGEDELAKVKEFLRGADFKVEELVHDQAHIEKTRVIKYGTRSEALKHIKNDEEPESTTISKLMRKITELESEVKTLKMKS